MKMQENLSKLESVLRATIGIALVAFSFTGSQWVSTSQVLVTIAIVGTILLLTGIQRSCPLYHLLGLSTR